MKRLWVIVIGVIVALALHNLNDYWVSSNTSDSVSTEARAKNAISYYFSDFTSVRTDSSGQALYELRGNHLAHRDQLQQSLINTPLITQQTPTLQQNSTLRAKKAMIDHEQDRVELTDDVHYQKQQSTVNTVNLQTDFLEYHPTKQRLHTDQAVLMTDNATVVQSTGMTAHLNDDNLELHSNVRTTYETH